MTAIAASHDAHVRRETAISAAINGVISLGFFVAVFGFGGDVPVKGAGNYAQDFLVQSLAVTFFGSFVPSLLTRSAMLKGKICANRSAPGVAAILLGSIIKGLVAAIVLGGAIALLLTLAGPDRFPFYPALIFKVAYGVILGGFATRFSLRRLLG